MLVTPGVVGGNETQICGNVILPTGLFCFLINFWFYFTYFFFNTCLFHQKKLVRNFYSVYIYIPTNCYTFVAAFFTNLKKMA